MEYIRKPSELSELRDTRTEWNEDGSSIDFHREGQPANKIIFERLLLEDIEKNIPIVYKKLELFEEDKESQKASVSRCDIIFILIT